MSLAICSLSFSGSSTGSESSSDRLSRLGSSADLSLSGVFVFSVGSTFLFSGGRDLRWSLSGGGSSATATTHQQSPTASTSRRRMEDRISYFPPAYPSGRGRPCLGGQVPEAAP